MKMSDETLAILEMGKDNLRLHIRNATLTLFDKILSEGIETYKSYDLPKDRKIAKSKKYLQLRLRDIVKYENNSSKYYEEFFVFITSESVCPYIEELIKQITSLQIKVFSKIRHAPLDSVGIDLPDCKKFTDDVLERNAFIIFHNIEAYYNCYMKRNPLDLESLIDRTTEEALNKLSSSVYNELFKKQKKPSEEERLQSKLDKSINKSINRADTYNPESIFEPPQEFKIPNSPPRKTSPQKEETKTISPEISPSQTPPRETSSPKRPEFEKKISAMEDPPSPPPLIRQTNAPPESPEWEWENPIGNKFSIDSLPQLAKLPDLESLKHLRKPESKPDDDDLLSVI